MKRAGIYFLLGIVCFYLDTLLAMLSPINIFGLQFVLVPRLTLMFLLLLTFYRNVYTAIILGILLGLMTDLYFGQIYGVYLISYLICILTIEKFFSLFYRDHSMVFLIVLVSIIGLDILVALIYSMVGMMQFDLIQFLFFRMPTTLLLNAVLLIFIYLILDSRQKRKRTIDMKIK
ncbi:rod shape-determining protein MreD [Staphylococcus ratti]|uniref:Rod shape-determining protein MreD n=1 Tax=Staphylococcus ratti TaxID=2892440 RepID=A0ABY3PFB4_9STAP|nr:rod shape-determining protein MreD [Staphylococcus ratti]UEX91016.1 rod shape-determining protein MreD [Staphylococcus ratti]